MTLAAMRFLNCMSVLLLVAIGGCGYHTAGSATHIPGNVRTLAIPVFKNNTQSYHTEVAFTQAVTQEMNTRTRYHVIANGDPLRSDAVLQGTILTQTVTPLTYDSTSGQTSSYLITITAKVMLTGQDGHVLYQNARFNFRQQYQSTQDLTAFIQEDSPAVTRLAREFAQAMVSDVLESF